MKADLGCCSLECATGKTYAVEYVETLSEFLVTIDLHTKQKKKLISMLFTPFSHTFRASINQLVLQFPEHSFHKETYFRALTFVVEGKNATF